LFAPETWTVHRNWQETLFAVFFLFTIGVSGVGVYALHTSPALGFAAGFWFSLSDPEIRQLADLELDETASLRLPEFFAPQAEARWWLMQEQIYARVRSHSSLPVTFIAIDGTERRGEARIDALPLTLVFKRTWLIYLVMIVCLGSARSVFRRHTSTEGRVLAFFLLACGLYFASAAPLTCRSLTLAPWAFRLLVLTLHFAASSFCTFAHFALIFPETTPLVRQHPWIVVLPYASSLPATLLYGAGVLAFGTTFPLLCLWVTIIVGLVLRSLVRSREPFLRRQLRLSLVAPVLVCLFFVGLYLLPGVLRVPPVDFRYFAVFFLILPFALPLGMDNLALYHERVAAERSAQQEKDHIRADLHDVILNNLAVISRSSEVVQTRLAEQGAGATSRLTSIRDLATATSRQLREFLWVLDDRHSDWEMFCSQLRQWGHELLEEVGCDLEVDVAPFLLKLPPPPVQLRICLDRVYKEALHNIVKHARATRVEVSIHCRGKTLVCAIHDDGVGFTPPMETNGRYGLQNIRWRVEDLGGRVKVESRQNQGTRLTVELPLP